MLKYQAAFDLYRYYLACCAGERRETPPRFQIDLYRYHLRQHDWLTGIICAVEQYQSYYGAMRTGDWGALRGLASFYAAKLPYYRHFARRAYGVGGARIPMWQGRRSPRAARRRGPGTAACRDLAETLQRREPCRPDLDAVALLRLRLDHRRPGLRRGVLSPLASRLVEFVRLRYPQREQGRMVIAPCNAGETWQGVRDPSEMVCALRDALPRLISRGPCQGWKKELVDQWEQTAGERARSPAGEIPVSGRGREAGDPARRSIGAGGGHERLRGVQTAVVRRQVASTS